MAMEIGGKYKSSEINIEHIEQMAVDAHLSPVLTKRRFVSIANQVRSKLIEIKPENEMQEQVSNHIFNRCNDLLARLSR